MVFDESINNTISNNSKQYNRSLSQLSIEQMKNNMANNNTSKNKNENGNGQVLKELMLHQVSH